MVFIINFNKSEEQDDFFLEELGAKLSTIYNKPFCFGEYEINIDNFEELKTLLKKVDNNYNDHYSAIITFNPATLFLDKDV